MLFRNKRFLCFVVCSGFVEVASDSELVHVLVQCAAWAERRQHTTAANGSGNVILPPDFLVLDGGEDNLCRIQHSAQRVAHTVGSEIRRL